jgi:hypothetical protein
MLTVKGIQSFANLFQARRARDAAGNETGEPKFNLTLLIAPNDPQVAMIRGVVDQVIRDTFPSGMGNKSDVCFSLYDEKYRGKDYYDPRFSGWWALTASAKESDRPEVVNMNYQKIVDPGKVFSGMVVYASVNIGGYTKGTGGIGCWINGVMVTDEEPPFGRLDNKPTVEQMFAKVLGGTATAPVSTPPAPPAPLAPPPVAPAPVARRMTAKAETTYEAYIAAGWSDVLLIQHGLMESPTGQPLSFQ